jgi:hypothetical protein
MGENLIIFQNFLLTTIDINQYFIYKDRGML